MTTIEKGGRDEVVGVRTGMTDIMIAKAQAAAETEKAMPFRQALRIFWRGGMWSMMLSVALIMEGYDIGLVSSLVSALQHELTMQLKAFYGHPAFLGSFGEKGPDGRLLITANWQAGLSNAVSAGQVCGLLVGLATYKNHLRSALIGQLNGWASYTFGYKRTYIAAMSAMIATIFIPVFAQNLPMLLAGNFINGIPWGSEYILCL